MGQLQHKLIQILEDETKKLKNDTIVQEFDKANKEFTELVNKGIVKRRGNHQMSIEQIHLRKYAFNTSSVG